MTQSDMEIKKISDKKKTQGVSQKKDNIGLTKPEKLWLNTALYFLDNERHREGEIKGQILEVLQG